MELRGVLGFRVGMGLLGILENGNYKDNRDYISIPKVDPRHRSFYVSYGHVIAWGGPTGEYIWF